MSIRTGLWWVLLGLMTNVSQVSYKIVDADWDTAKAVGWTEEELLEAHFTTSLFGFITRMVDSLGLGTSVAGSRISQLDPTGEQG